MRDDRARLADVLEAIIRIGMRHILVHDYVGIDVDVVWSAVEHDLPALKRQVEALLKN